MFARFKNTESVLTWLICLAYFGMFFPIQFSNITIIALIAFCLIKGTYRETLRLIRASAFLKIMIGLYLVQIIGLLYTANLDVGYFMLEKKVTFLLIPLIVFPVLLSYNVDNQLLLKRLGVITILSSVVLLILALFKKFILEDPQAFFYEEFTSIHYVYYSLYFACGSLILIDSVFENWIRKRYGILLIISLFLYSLGILIFVASKTGILGFSLATLVFMYKKIPNKKIFIAAVVLFLFSISVFLYLNPTSRERFVGLGDNLAFLKYDDLRNKEVYITDLNMRLLFWKISLTHLWEDGLVWTGLGTGDAQDYIDTLYVMPQHTITGYIGWDSHNQWVFTLIQVGVMGVGVMALLFLKYFKEAWARSDLKLQGFLIITFAFSLSESILESNKGIVFFVLFLTVLSSAYHKQEGAQA